MQNILSAVGQLDNKTQVLAKGVANIYEQQQKQDRLNIAIWQCGVAIKELQSIVDDLSKLDVDKEAS